MVWHLRDLLDTAHFSRAHRRVAVGLGNRWAARVIANSEATATAFVAGGGHAAKVRVVHNGIAPEPFAEADDARVEALRDELGLREVSKLTRSATFVDEDEVEEVVDLEALAGDEEDVEEEIVEEEEPETEGEVVG